MLKKTIRRLGALAMVLAMAVSVFAVNASAVTSIPGLVNGDTMTITKNVTAAENVYAPVTSFNFTVATAGSGEFDGNVVYAGVDNGVYFVDNKNSIDFDASMVKNTAGNYTGTTQLKVDIKKFTAPGVYHYTVSETKDSYDGITYDTAARDLYVYITNGSSGLEVSNVVLGKWVEKSANDKIETVFVKDDSWTNVYNGVYTLTVTKAVTGLQGDKNKDFKFTVSVAGVVGEKYKVEYKTKESDTNWTVATLDSSNTTTTGATKSLEINLKDTGIIKIYGLSATDTYTISEENYSTDGYTTSYKVGTANAVSANTATDAMGNADTSIVYTNNKEGNTPTGVIMTIAPYALMVVLAGAFAVVFLSRRNRAE